MSIVVGCPSCGQISQVPSVRNCGKCGTARVLLMTLEENTERQSRGVNLERWFGAPATPANRGACEDGPRPCPYLRCKYQLGAPGNFGCALDVADEGEHTQEQVGALLGLDHRSASLIERTAVRNAREHAGHCGNCGERSKLAG